MTMRGAYQRVLARSPNLTQAATTAALFAAGDVLAQQAIERKGSSHDLMRTGRLTLYGGAIFAPIAVKWYSVLDRLPIQRKASLVAARVGLDQFVFSPIMLGVFFTMTTLMEPNKHLVPDVKDKIQTSWKPALFANWAVFIPVQTLNMIVPLQHRLLFVNTAALFWNSYLSFTTQGGGDKVHFKTGDPQTASTA